MPTYPVKLYTTGLTLVARGVGKYNYTYGSAVPVMCEADFTKFLDGRTADEALYFSNMLDYAANKAIRDHGVSIGEAQALAEPMAGCTMVCFTEEGKGVESARVSLTHTTSGRVVLAYARTVNGAIHNANAEMEKLLKV